MSRITVEKKGSAYIVKNKLVHPELINERMLSDIQQGKYHAFLPITMNSKTLLEAQVVGCSPLPQYFSVYSTRQYFLNVITQVASVIKACESELVDERRIDLEPSRVFVDVATGTVRLLYWPVANAESNGDGIKTFFQQARTLITVSTSEDEKFMQKYQDYLSQNAVFTINNFERFLTELTLWKMSNVKKGDLVYSGICVGEMNKPINGGVMISTPTPTPTPERITQKSIYQCGGSQGVSQGVAPQVNAVQMGGAYVQFKQRSAYLVNVATEARHAINKACFGIGRRETNDCCIAGNKAVSGEHADILTRNNRYYIFDKGSTNRTYVNGVVIAPGIEVELFNNTQVRIANVGFRFEIQN